MLIYKAVNKINGKIYIGKTIGTLKERKKCHYKPCEWKRNPNSVFYKAIRKYGKENFEWYIIKRCDSEEELNKKEIYFIKKFKSLINENGYNMTKGGTGGDIISSHPNKKEICNKKRNSMIGKNVGSTNAATRPEVKNKISKTLKEKYKNGFISPSNKTWKIIFPDGYIEITKNLKKFCERNKWKYENLVAAKNRGRLHKGCKVKEVLV